MVNQRVIWRTRRGATWRYQSGVYGNWKTVYNRHRRWSGDQTWVRILDELRRDADMAEGAEWMVGLSANFRRRTPVR